ncbi:MAG TPA: class II fructose-bisphosphate aldolase [Candidatus Paceibacterota bacterium]|jgi:fructose-bisphosphate aldolase class II|nr:class II fructose-bisphosphate aldolase [Candidatus Paceibacterota bacterium]
MQTLREALEDARGRRIALGHFNISDSNQFRAVKEAAKKCGIPAVVGVSEGEREFLGVREAVALVMAARADGVDLFLNADHTHTVDKVKEAIDAGFDSVIFDGSHFPFDENVKQTREAVAYARACGRDVLVEGELGMIGTGSEVLDAPPQDIDKDLTDPQEAARFARESGIDLIAPAVGNMHGVLRSGAQQKLDTHRIEEIAQATGLPVVLHGGSGSSDADFVAAAKAGAALIHISTDLRVAFRRGVEQGLAQMPNEVAPYKYIGPAVAADQALVERFITLFAQS